VFLDREVPKALALEVEEAEPVGTLGFMARFLIQTTMPDSKSDMPYFQRRLRLVQRKEMARTANLKPSAPAARRKLHIVRSQSRFGQPTMRRAISPSLAALRQLTHLGHWTSYKVNKRLVAIRDCVSGKELAYIQLPTVLWNTTPLGSRRTRALSRDGLSAQDVSKTFREVKMARTGLSGHFPVPARVPQRRARP
jgi:hypothetical protein